MATASTINIDQGGQTITFSATSEPSNPTISITGTTWATVSGSKITVSENTGASGRTATVSVKATTPSNSDYNGTASVTSAYTISQDGAVVDGAHAEALDIVLESKENNDVIIVKRKAWYKSRYPKEKWDVVGIVVIPGSHGVIKDGNGTVNQCGVMGTMQLDHRSPGKRNSLSSDIYFGGYGVDISGQSDGLGRYDSVTDGLKNYNCVAGSTDYIRDHPSTGLQSLLKGGYKMIPRQEIYTAEYFHSGYINDWYIRSPYAGDRYNTGPYNENYGTTKFDTDSDFNCLSDFSGIVNTKILTDLATGQEDWRTASAITNNSGATYYPAACCAARYKTRNTKAFVDCTTEELKQGSGFWYLPAAGEFGYIPPKLADIHDLMEKLDDAYGSYSVSGYIDIDGFLTSTQINGEYTVVIEPTYGRVENDTPFIYATEGVYPFMRL